MRKNMAKKTLKYNVEDRKMNDKKKALFDKRAAKAQKAEEKQKVAINEESDDDDDYGIEMLDLEY